MLAVRGRIAHLPAEVPCPANPPSDPNYSPPTPHELNNENSIFMGPEKKKNAMVARQGRAVGVGGW